MQKTDETTHRHPNGIFPKEKLRAGVWNGWWCTNGNSECAPLLRINTVEHSHSLGLFIITGKYLY
jgi:hypothetical protein